jgi:hypothetical protein
MVRAGRSQLQFKKASLIFKKPCALVSQRYTITPAHVSQQEHPSLAIGNPFLRRINLKPLSALTQQEVGLLNESSLEENTLSMITTQIILLKDDQYMMG